MQWIVGVNPECVVVGVNVPAAKILERFTAVFGFTHAGMDGIDAVFVERIYKNIVVVKGAVANFVLVVHHDPGCSAVGRTVKGILFGFEEGIDDVGFGGRNSQTRSSEFALGQTIFGGSLSPCFTPVVGDVDSGARSAGVERPGLASVFPHSCDEFVGVLRVNDEICHTGLVIDIEYFFPRLTAIGGFVHPSFCIGSPDRTHGSHKNHIRVVGMDDDAVDGFSFFQPHVHPGFTAIETFKNPNSAVVGVSGVPLSGTHPDFAGILLVDGDCADRLIVLVVEDGRPGCPSAL